MQLNREDRRVSIDEPLDLSCPKRRNKGKFI